MLLTAKYRAAQLAQGYIDVAAFRDYFRTDIAEVLHGVLFPRQAAALDQASKGIEVKG